MVMGPTHAMSGAAAGLILPSILPGMTATPAVSLSFAGVCAGAALLPDIDSPGSTVSRSLGPLTWALSKVVNKVSWAFYSATSGPKDNHRDGGHRTLTHTGAFAAAVGIGVTALTGWGGRYAVLAVLFFMASLAIRGLLNDWARNNGWIGIAAAAAVLTFAASLTMPDAGQGWLGLAVGIGIVLHDAGDAITKNGCAFLAPLVTIHGKRWWEFALPGPLRITAGGWAEKVLLLPVLTAVTLVLVIQVFPIGQQATTAVWDAATGLFA
jgi:hypothetical protein